MVKQLVSDREKQELLVLIKTEFKNNQQVWGNKFWQRLEGKGAVRSILLFNFIFKYFIKYRVSSSILSLSRQNLD